MSTAIRIQSTLAVMGALREIIPLFEAEAGITVDAEFAPTVALLTRLREGNPADAAILTAHGVDDLIGEGIIRAGTRQDVARSFVGIAVKAGAAKPDIGSLGALKTTLTTARAVAYSRIGASGLFFADLIRRLGIEAAVNDRAVIVPSGFTAERLVSGEAELAVQQISELMVVPGIEVVGPLPTEVQTPAIFSAGLLTDSAAATAFCRFLTSAKAAPILRRSGLEPVSGTN